MKFRDHLDVGDKVDAILPGNHDDSWERKCLANGSPSVAVLDTRRRINYRDYAGRHRLDFRITGGHRGMSHVEDIPDPSVISPLKSPIPVKLSASKILYCPT